MKRNKALGPDNIPAEACKADIETTMEIVYPMFKKIWQQERIPYKWKESLLMNSK
jgi:hypothetical protein